MASEDIVMIIDKPHVTVKLHKDLLEVDLKKGVKKKLEGALESKPILRESLGFLFQTVVPVDVPLRSIESVSVNKEGQVKVAIPFRKDIVIPLTPKEAEGFVDKLNQLIAIEKRKAEAKDVVMVIDKPHFTVKLHKTVLQVDLKKGIRKELEDVLEARPAIRGSLGFLFQTVIPLDVPLKDVNSVNVDEKGQIKIITLLRRDIVIPLERSESRRLAEKLNELIPIEKERVLRDLLAAKRAEIEDEFQRGRAYEEERRELIR